MHKIRTKYFVKEESYGVSKNFIERRPLCRPSLKACIAEINYKNSTYLGAYSFRYSEYSISMEYFGTVCRVLRGVAHQLTELPRDSRWRREQSYFNVKEQCSENTPLRTGQ